MRDNRADEGRTTLRDAGGAFVFRRDHRLMSVGDAATDVVLLGAGLVKIVLPDRAGGQPIAGVCGPGELLGDIGAMYAEVRTASVVALSPGHGWRLPADRFLHLHDQHRSVRDLVHETLRRRQQILDERQVWQTRTLLVRLARELRFWADRFGRRTDAGARVDGLTQEDIAGVLGASRQHVEDELRRLREQGLIRTARCTFTVVDPARLDELIQPDR
ncbi:Crp/Fnr family transcriptional regulator [Saccharopolyspora sp. NPDC047091]|uniref:Crp/Fnr family transcriptional regulator n=1 Tax=Saccharopolyspora sp. NPDC047091 TaxID=3155924 RepID=UPI0033F39C55